MDSVDAHMDGRVADGQAEPHKSFTVRLPLRTVNELNAREHWSTRSRRAAEQRGLARIAVMPLIVSRQVCVPCVVTLTRVGARLVDPDAVSGCLKHVQDGVADALGIDDGSPLIAWRYTQERGPYGVRIAIAPGAERS